VVELGVSLEMKTSAGREAETKTIRKQDRESNTENIAIEEDEYKTLKEKADLYDEIQKKCEELEKEIAELQIKYQISEEEIKKIDEELRDELDEKKKLGDKITLKNEEKSKTLSPFQSNSSSSPNVKCDDEFVSEKESKTIPSEWKILKRKSDRKRRFESPEGFSFDSRSAALQFMIKSKYPEHLLSLMRNHLQDEGWYQDKSCPNRWKTRKISGTKDYQYLSPNMVIISSMEEMLSHLKSQNTTNTKEITNLENKIISLKSDSKPAEKKAPVITETGSSGKGRAEEEEEVEKKSSKKQECQNEGKLNEPKANTDENVKKILEGHFQESVFPDDEKLGKIGEGIGKSVQEVKKWFLKRASEEGKKRMKRADSNQPIENNSNGSQKKNTNSFKDLSDDQKAALKNVLSTSSDPSDEIMTNLATDHQIDRRLVMKWFKLKRQQRVPSK